MLLKLRLVGLLRIAILFLCLSCSNESPPTASNTTLAEQLQKALDDNYVAYELNANTRRADLRPAIYSDLHAKILDAFHTAGVEITSPHYRANRDGNEVAIAAVMTSSKPDAS